MGTYSKLVQTPPTPDKEAEPAPAPTPPKTSDTSILATAKQEVKSVQASMQANKHASKRASTHGEKRVNKRENKRTSNHIDLHAQMLTLLEEKATNGYTFRYPPQLLEMLEDLLPAVRKRHQVKLTKNAIAVAAIVFLLSDYETFDAESVLYQLLIAPLVESQ